MQSELHWPQAWTERAKAEARELRGSDHGCGRAAGRREVAVKCRRAV
ncbi:unnamed protein product [Gulo gulo]|uniref:Uncharacterized protein n=1 Tax=Gulo gulo TaxID=48420 RepID=A0A9X9LDA8_GULGU|nr:unnamed protein product [Gulo gulo]